MPDQSQQNNHNGRRENTPSSIKTSVDSEGSSPVDKKASGKKKNPYLAMFKKVGVTVWIAVMVIGGILAFFTALFLL